MTMRIAIVTPYWREPRGVLEACIASVAAQRLRADHLPADHLLVADGAPQDWIDGAGVRHLRLPGNHADFGNVARGVGALLAAGEGYDAIGFLDADNRIDPDHVALCLAAARRAGACDCVVAQRRFVLPDGTPVPIAEEPGLVDTNCLFLLPGAFPAIARWALIPPPLAGIGDRLFHAALLGAGCTLVAADRPSVTYVSRWARHYEALGLAVPGDARRVDLAAMRRWVEGLSPEARRALDHRLGVTIALR
jgi:glycosyltransferase involved in cell wall biosynthesis